ncbi:MAG TPA: bifunctional pyr operon transcriptional regulator/uracil phosphoribosyltransferase PyrR [Candidatus Didemnitutus sp.]|nr:bifunctional pyr operon transcriptional regulator/uracil phosphoribosyltransferase PyrR [Candidatus Didemnitutus sp.]
MGTPKKHDANAVAKAVALLVSSIAARHGRTRHLILLGIANGGIPLAARLAEGLRNQGMKCGVGTIDISFHRDDISHHPIPKEFAATLIPHDVNNATVILVDDVIFSGRTVKAALDELFDYGRPERVELAALVDRPGRRLPFAADYIGLTLAASEGEKVVVHLDPANSGNDEIVVAPSKAARLKTAMVKT